MNLDSNILNKYMSELSISVKAVEYAELSKKRYGNFTVDFSSIGLICEGEGNMKSGETEIFPTKGQLYLMPANTTQSFYFSNNNTHKKYYCHFNTTVGSISIFDIIKFPLCVTPRDFEKIKNTFKILHETFNNKGILSTFKINSLFFEILNIYTEACGNNIFLQSKDENIMIIMNTVKYIENNIANELTVELLAKMTGFNPQYFIRLFKKVTGLPPAHYINVQRLEKAKGLLLMTNMDICKIANEVGFKSQFYFSSSFKKYTNLSPVEFRLIYTK